MRWLWKSALGLAALLVFLGLLKEWFLRQVDLYQNNQMIEPASCRLQRASEREPDPDLLLHPLYSSGARPPEAAAAAQRSLDAACGKGPGAGYAVGVVPGGRRDRMRLLVPYLDSLVADARLDEVHIWDTSQVPEDKEWMERIAVARPRFRFFRPRYDLGKRLMFYDFYAVEPAFPRSGSFQPLCPWATPNNTVIIKIDDDIVFVNTSGVPLFTSFVRRHPEMLITYANIVNNGVAAYYQSQHVPELRSALPELSAYPVRSQRPGFCGALFSSASKALRLHRLFAAAPERFAWGEPEGDGCIAFRPPEGVGNPRLLGQGSFSVNFFGVRWAAWQELPDLLRCVDIDFDEPLLSVLATRLGYRECMFTQLNVAHLSFRTQEENPKMAEALPIYEDLLMRYMNSTPASTE